MQESAAPPTLDSQRLASHLWHHLISLIVDIFDTAVQIPRPRAQHGAVAWRHTIGERADIVLLAQRFAFETIGGWARQKVTCTFSNAAVEPLLESLPLHRSRHSIWSCLFAGAIAANATSKNSGFTLAVLAHGHYTSWTRKLEEKSSGKKKEDRVRDPCHATRIEDRRPPDSTALNTVCLPIEITCKDVSLFQPDNRKNASNVQPGSMGGGTMGASDSEVPQLEVRGEVSCFCEACAS